MKDKALSMSYSLHVYTLLGYYVSSLGLGVPLVRSVCGLQFENYSMDTWTLVRYMG